MAGEVTGGLLANSLAILTDAAHLLCDLASFLIALAALYLVSRSWLDSFRHSIAAISCARVRITIVLFNTPLLSE